ncbi:N-acetyl-gamma-glutamyl-phosphate reductase [Oxobacter pfennigii]|uniref:N-acetyl-gamma-glutamyl-phosphate reductase n=1 Tax=Oxobacter pfennigii TaxID=36849 RepID=A0A0P8Z171_9CLOT|nr:N-acetyl-gamma-glutamyl-phosphate reductase [Oxobacter pfennigii]KPU45879.1 N-acetyl-gamma-glutamyl-phosphate reductase [Oxobacter pfennigii]
MISASIVGATGYVGEELVRILSTHPDTKIVGATTQNYVGQDIGDVFPSLRGRVNLVCEELNIQNIVKKSDIIFLSLPHGHSAALTKEVLSYNKKIIDMGADFRFDSKEVYEKWYGVSHALPEVLSDVVYGLPEINREKIKDANIIGNPGCYPTSIILGLAPVLENNLVETESIISDSKSAISGAGRGASVSNLFTEISGSVKAYNISKHRHTPEINQELSKLAKNDVHITFTPHVVPMSRGILSTIYCRLKNITTAEDVIGLYKEYYRGSSFVRIMNKGVYPETRWVYGSNFCDIGFEIDEYNKRLIIVSAIDNVVKGAAGQGIQNMNIMFGLPETTGLEAPGLYI